MKLPAQARSTRRRAASRRHAILPAAARSPSRTRRRRSSDPWCGRPRAMRQVQGVDVSPRVQFVDQARRAADRLDVQLDGVISEPGGCRPVSLSGGSSRYYPAKKPARPSSGTPLGLLLLPVVVYRCVRASTSGLMHSAAWSKPPASGSDRRCSGTRLRLMLKAKIGVLALPRLVKPSRSRSPVALAHAREDDPLRRHRPRSEAAEQLPPETHVQPALPACSRRSTLRFERTSPRSRSGNASGEGLAQPSAGAVQRRRRRGRRTSACRPTPRSLPCRSLAEQARRPVGLRTKLKVVHAARLAVRKAG